MSESTSSAVDCPVCGESFDPTEAGGWCTNVDCGEWQYIGDEVPEPAAPERDEGVTAPDLKRSADESDDGEGDETAEAAGDAADASTADADEPAAASAANDPGPDDDETDAGPTPAIRRVGDEPEEESAPGADAESAAASPGATTGASEGAADEAEHSAGQPDAVSAVAEATDDAPCPDCGDPVDPDDNFCASCGADLDAVIESTLAACPSCEAAIDPDDSYCPSCGEDLEAARAALEAAADEPGEGVTAAASDGADDGGVSDGDGTVPESLVLRVRGEEIDVADGETLGREVRSVITQTGGEEDQAVRVHREHLRFVRDDGRFFLVDLGDNPTRLNGTRLSKGDREPVGPGDEIELSGVATLAVDSP